MSRAEHLLSAGDDMAAAARSVVTQGLTAPEQEQATAKSRLASRIQRWDRAARDAAPADEQVAQLARERDEAVPLPTSVAEAVCRCIYNNDRSRAYRCRTCAAGYGPDRGTFPTPYEQWKENQR